MQSRYPQARALGRERSGEDCVATAVRRLISVDVRAPLRATEKRSGHGVSPIDGIVRIGPICGGPHVWKVAIDGDLWPTSAATM